MLLLMHPSWAIFAGIVLFFLYFVWDKFFSRQGLPDTLPWAGAERGAFSRAKATCQSLFGMRNLIQEGYYKFSKANEAFILPNLITGPEVILPSSQLPWLLDQPDHILNQHEVNRQFLHADRTMLHPNIVSGTVHKHVIRREMTRYLDSFAADLVDEIEHSLRQVWGSDEAWHEISVYDAMLNIVSRISNRALVGLPLCRTEDYLRSSRTFDKNVVITAGLLNFLPPVLRSVLGPLIIAYDMLQYRRITKYVLPLIKNRAVGFHPGLDYKKPDYTMHNDYVQWALHDAFSHHDPVERTPEMITKRLTVLSFATIQSSVITITNALFDIASSPSSVKIQRCLREEVERVSPKGSVGSWNGAKLARMVRVDSALRESMRLWGFVSRGVVKMVMVPGGVRIPSGEHLPFRAKVGVTAYAVHHDESIYPNAYEYDAFRFTPAASNPDDKVDEQSGKSTKGASMVNSSQNFMGFSHGSHICPGRFFASNLLKLLLAHIALEYDIEPIGVRPENPWLNNSIGPPIWSKLRIRRRDQASHVTFFGPVSSFGGDAEAKC